MTATTTGPNTAIEEPAVPAVVTCVDYSPDRVEVQQVEDLAGFLAQHRPQWSVVRWIDVTGLRDAATIDAVAAKYELHPLAIEDLLSHTQRPKIDTYGGQGSALRARLFLTARALHVADGRLRSTPISIFLGHTTVLTFQAEPTGVWDAVRQRLAAAGSRVRLDDASFLVYSLLDTLVDAVFPLLEHLDGEIDRLETTVVEHATPAVLAEVQDLKRQLAQLRWAVWPLREVVTSLQRDPHECMSEDAQVHLHDLYDHIVQVIEIVEMYRERAGDLTESYRSAVSFRMNEVMKVLTIIGTIFIPLTFLAGVYGMNFRHLPELAWTWAYPAFWVVCLVVAGGMLAMFRRRGWF